MSRFTSPLRTAILALAVLSLAVTLAVSAVAAVPVTVGFRGPVFSTETSPGNDAEEPTKDDPQSKVWYADGKWWAGMFDMASQGYVIHRLDGTEWVKTSTALDDRNDSHADYLFDGSKLHVVSVAGDNDDDPIEYYRYGYNTANDTWNLENGPTEVGMGESESVTIAKSGTNLWVTYTNPDGMGNRKVMVNNSTDNGNSWGTPRQLVAGGESVVTNDEAISAVVAFGSGGSNIGIMWSDQRVDETSGDDETEFRFAVNSSPSGTTFGAPETAASGGETFAEDHFNVKVDPSGRVVAAAKTNGGPHIQLLVRNSNGTWNQHVVASSTVAATRPQLVINGSTNEAWVFYTVPVLHDDGDQKIYYKKASLASPSFPTGTGTLFIDDGTNDVNDISLTKQIVTSTSGVLGIASSDENSPIQAYYHNLLGASTPTPTPSSATPTPSGSASPSATPKPSASPTPTPTTNPFKDVSPTNKFYNDILWAYHSGVTVGCPPYDRFCPTGLVTRAQMATFIVRALNLPPATGPDRFDDDDGNIHEDRINALAAAGITVGCGAPSERRFCPDGLVTREQMATFLVRALNLPPTNTDYFVDDETSKHEARINALRASGITSGCGDPAARRFCPSGSVTRQQMAAFLHRGVTR